MTAPKNGKTAAKKRKPDAIAILKEDHAKVKKMFGQFARSDSPVEKEELAKLICAELTVHTTIEEEIFYPAAREALDDGDPSDEATVEHASAKDLIAQIENATPDAVMWDAKVTVLGEYINHHVEEEHKELFPQVRKSKLDLQGLGRAMMERKEQLELANAKHSYT